MCLVRVAVIVALKASILAEVIAPVIASIRVAAVLKVYELHSGHHPHCSSRLHLLMDNNTALSQDVAYSRACTSTKRKPASLKDVRCVGFV